MKELLQALYFVVTLLTQAQHGTPEQQQQAIQIASTFALLAEQYIQTPLPNPEPYIVSVTVPLGDATTTLYQVPQTTVMPKPKEVPVLEKIDLWDLDPLFAMDDPRVSEYSDNTREADGTIHVHLNGNSTIMFRVYTKYPVDVLINTVTVHVKDDGTNSGYAEYKNVPPGIYDYVVKVINGGKYAELKRTVEVK